MPIKPENKHRYPKNWKQIRADMLKRANNKCEWCGLENHIMGIREKDGSFYEMTGLQLDTARDNGFKIIQIVLTIATWTTHQKIVVQKTLLRFARNVTLITTENSILKIGLRFYRLD